MIGKSFETIGHDNAGLIGKALVDTRGVSGQAVKKKIPSFYNTNINSESIEAARTSAIRTIIIWPSQSNPLRHKTLCPSHAAAIVAVQ